MPTFFEIEHQAQYSRGELLLRTFLGYFYILIPHAFVLMFVGLWGSILSFLAWWIILFTGRYPESFFEFQEKLLRWTTRVNASFLNLVDGYPAFGLEEDHPGVHVEIEYPEKIDRGLLLLRTFFGIFYVIIPHGFILMFRMFATYLMAIAAWFTVLFTKNYPEEWHRFNVGTLRWSFRVNLYMSFMTDVYPPFSGRPNHELYGYPDPLEEPPLLLEEADLEDEDDDNPPEVDDRDLV